MAERRPYRRESEERRREDLIVATLDLVAEGGLDAATVRAIADRAGVTPGLIRHYFSSKEDLTRVAYHRFMDQMTTDSAAVLLDGPDDALARLANFVVASVSPPVADPVSVGLWAAFVHDVRRNAAMRDIHTANYLAFRNMLQGLIAALPRSVSDTQLRCDAIACNGVIDGLWLEASILPEAFGLGEIPAIALTSVGAILNLNLVAAYQPDRTLP